MFLVGGEKGDAFINFSSDEDARQAMVKGGSICGNPIKLFLSSRSEMQSVIALARANPSGKTVPTPTETSYEQQDQTKIPSANALSSMLADFQAKAVQQQQQQQQLQMQQQPTSMIDSNNGLFLAAAAAAAQNGTNPLAIQQLLAALSEKQQQQQQQMSFPMPVIPNPINQFPQQTNGWMPQQVNDCRSIEINSFMFD